jgi:hypothetical protein
MLTRRVNSRTGIPLCIHLRDAESGKLKTNQYDKKENTEQIEQVLPSLSLYK